jgi:hypothetical protein
MLEDKKKGSQEKDGEKDMPMEAPTLSNTVPVAHVVSFLSATSLNPEEAQQRLNSHTNQISSSSVSSVAFPTNALKHQKMSLVFFSGTSKDLVEKDTFKGFPEDVNSRG